MLFLFQPVPINIHFLQWHPMPEAFCFYLFFFYGHVKLDIGILPITRKVYRSLGIVFPYISVFNNSKMTLLIVIDTTSPVLFHFFFLCPPYAVPWLVSLQDGLLPYFWLSLFPIFFSRDPLSHISMYFLHLGLISIGSSCGPKISVGAG